MHKSGFTPTDLERKQALSYLVDHQLMLLRLMAMEPKRDLGPGSCSGSAVAQTGSAVEQG